MKGQATGMMAAALAAAAAVQSCRGDEITIVQGCVPGEQQECPCLDGSEGVQVCGATADRWGPCQCGAAGAGGAAGDAGWGGVPAGAAGRDGQGGTALAGMAGSSPDTGGSTSGTSGGTGGSIYVTGGTGGTDAAGGSLVTGGTDAAGGSLVTGGTGGTGGSLSTAGTGGTGGTGGSFVTGGTGGQVYQGDSGIIPDDGGNYAMDWNVSGVIGSWYTYQDSGGSTITSAYEDPNNRGPFGNENGEFCFSGTVVGHMDSAFDTNWGVGLGLDVCAFPDDLRWLPADLQSVASPEQKFPASDCPTRLAAVNSVTFTVTGFWTELRVGFKLSTSGSDESPFVVISEPGTYTVNVTEARVPSEWDVPNAGQVGNPDDVYALRFQIASQPDDDPYELCISDLTID